MVDYYTGIDWASDHHDIQVLDKEGDEVRSFQVKHNPEGIRQLCNSLKELAGGDPSRIAIAIETSHGLLVSALIDEGFLVYPVNPKESERRRKSSGAKTDFIDANNLAKMLRTEIKDMKPFKPSSETIAELRQLTRDQNGLIQTKTALVNQLRACLRDYFPAFLGLFSELDGDASLAFLRRYPTMEKALRLSMEQEVFRGRARGWRRDSWRDGETTGADSPRPRKWEPWPAHRPRLIKPASSLAHAFVGPA